VEAFIKAGVFADWLLLVVLVASPVNYEVKRLHKGAARQIGAMEGPQPALPTPGPNGGNAVPKRRQCGEGRTGEDGALAGSPPLRSSLSSRERMRRRCSRARCGKGWCIPRVRRGY
jgi:hypothetical protein